ncbi:hypothetical protein ASPVEDRAFT_671641 [Aspergillus versicolor CBS 583.65]|uniref:Uncharacterized protein n=1 Tax=Aspergillus versicolor CBS 583.65 TaxID=1036611 RepID=A0A1L9PLN6_ASPVE|nr:uncharacterized protein ASPVEDRAFT_671641 [Aspergillus versicolor CBS 583.65]OJJ02382.1 hypothetical protein ASPVEDRAFT_671641 [Aspergillus versicolor CBS 583.65]
MTGGDFEYRTEPNSDIREPDIAASTGAVRYGISAIQRGNGRYGPVTQEPHGLRQTLQNSRPPIIQTSSFLVLLPFLSLFHQQKELDEINIAGVHQFPFFELFVIYLPLLQLAFGILWFQRPQSPRLTQPVSCSPVTLYPLDVFETLLTTSPLLLLLPRVFTPIGAPFSHTLTPTEIFPSPIELPHRTSLTVLPLKEEGSRRLGPVNYGCETFRPP